MIPIDDVPATINTASEAIRAINHATRVDNLNIADTYATLGSLIELVGRLPQCLEQTVRGVTADPSIQSDTGEPQTDVAAIGGHITAACAALEQVTRHLNDAHNHASRLHA